MDDRTHSPTEHDPPGRRLPGAEQTPPEVATLLEQGWELAPDAPVWAFLPALWPSEDRTWVADRAARTVVTTCDGIARVEAWSAQDYAERDADLDELVRRAGVPDRPRGRLWLLRGPARVTVGSVLNRIEYLAAADGVPFRSSPELTALTRRVLARVFR